MMKRFIILCLCLFLCADLTACNGKSNVKSNAKTGTEIPFADDSKVDKNSKISDLDSLYKTDKKSSKPVLIAYFSRVGNTDFPNGVDTIASASLVVKNNSIYGNTQYLATLIQQETGGNLFSVQVEEKYPADYDATVDRAQKENSNSVHPKLSSHVDNMQDYQVVFLGYPNWWYDMPMAIYSFLDEYDLSGKTIVPFCTSGGSGFSKSIDTIRKLEPGATILDGFTVRDSKMNNFSPDSVKDWLSGEKL